MIASNMPKLPIHLENQTIGAFPEANYSSSLAKVLNDPNTILRFSP